jgi:hypothetical protein
MMCRRIALKIGEVWGSRLYRSVKCFAAMKAAVFDAKARDHGVEKAESIKVE